jgi:hypothetical protein
VAEAGAASLLPSRRVTATWVRRQIGGAYYDEERKENKGPLRTNSTVSKGLGRSEGSRRGWPVRDRAGQAGEGKLLARKSTKNRFLGVSLRTCMQLRREFHLFADWSNGSETVSVVKGPCRHGMLFWGSTRARRVRGWSCGWATDGEAWECLLRREERRGREGLTKGGQQASVRRKRAQGTTRAETPT